MRNTRLLPLLAVLAFAPFLQAEAGIGDYPQAAAPDAPSGKEWESEQMLGLNKEKPRATFNSYADIESAKSKLRREWRFPLAALNPHPPGPLLWVGRSLCWGDRVQV